MPNLGTIGELIVKIKAEDAKETGEQIKSVQKTTKDAGQEAKRQVPVLEKMGRRWGAVLSLVAASGAVAFGMILKSSPSVMGALKGIQLAFESIFGLIGEELSPIFEWLEEILWKVSEAFENLSPEIKTFVAGLTLAVIVGGMVAAAVLAIAVGLPLLAGALGVTVGALLVLFAKVLLILGVVGIAVGILFTAWKHNWGGIQDKTKDALQFIRDVISRVTRWISSRWETFLGILFNKNLSTYGKLKALWGFLKNTIKQITTAIKKETAKAWEAIKRKSLEIWNAIKVAIPAILNKLKAIMAAIWADIKASAAELWDDLKKIITGKVQETYDAVVGKFADMITALKKTIKYFHDNPIIRIIKTIKKTISSGMSTMARQFGGPVSAGAAYTVGEVGEELFVPDVSGTIVPHNELTERKTTPAAASTRPININLDLKLDGRTVWESMRRYSAAEIRRLGG
ncbi:hypothetical protein GQ473_03000 [archaeon]|nr:hypothetical protein [archaeon]